MFTRLQTTNLSQKVQQKNNSKPQTEITKYQHYNLFLRLQSLKIIIIIIISIISVAAP